MTRTVRSDLMIFDPSKKLVIKPNPSLLLEILIYLHKWFTLLWFCSSFILYIEKLRLFFYTSESCAWEMSMMVLIPVIDFVRLKLASRGNKTEKWDVLLWSSVLSAPLIVGHVFFLRLQFYVLRYDFYLNTAALVLVALEVIVSMYTIRNYYQYSQWNVSL